MIKDKDIDGIYIMAYRRQLMALAWNFAVINFNLVTNTNDNDELLIEPTVYAEKVASLFDRYLKQWENQRP